MLDFTRYLTKSEYSERPDVEEGSKAYSAWRESKEKHEAEVRLRVAQFIEDALTDLEIINHPKAYQAFDIAFQEKWISSGYSGVYHLLAEIATLLKN
jgi:hypothetical protein